MSERKHFYLITEHEDEERVGDVSILGMQLSQPLKNEEGPVTVRDEQERDFVDVGKQVHLGYYDFADGAYEDDSQVAEVMQEKIREVDAKWAKKAGVYETVYGEQE